VPSWCDSYQNYTEITPFCYDFPHRLWHNEQNQKASVKKGDYVLKREQWLHLARKLDWEYSYVREEEVFPEVISGRPWLPHSEWQD